MAATQDGKTFKQDMVVSIRYRNDLPPPPMPPKLLDIEHAGIAQYLTTGYAAGLARREEPNVEADAEGGMPIDMIGVPGYFLGLETAIMAPAVQPVLDPEDAALMLTPEQLKTGGAMNKGHAFLRKTVYMNAANASAQDPLVSKPTPRSRKQLEKSAPVARDDPENIKRHIQKGFDLAYPDSIAFNTGKGEQVTPAERHAWKNPTHPTNPSLKPVGFYPVLPDLDAITDGGGYWTYLKFAKPPLPAHHERRDDRIDSAFISAIENQKELSLWRARKEAFERDPKAYEDPGPEPYIWSLHIPREGASVNKIRKLFNEADQDKDSEAWISELSEQDATGQSRIPFTRVRAYPSIKNDSLDSRRMMGVTLFDADKAAPSSRLKKAGNGSAAYYYPIMERTIFKTERGQALGGIRNRSGHHAASQTADDEDELTRDLPDELMLLPQRQSEMSAVQRFGRMQFRGQYDTAFEGEFKDLETEARAEHEAEEAKEIVEEQGSLHEGAADVSMAEIEAADDTEIAGSDGAGYRRDRDSFDDDERNGNDSRRNYNVREGDDQEEDDDDLMEDD